MARRNKKKGKKSPRGGKEKNTPEDGPFSSLSAFKARMTEPGGPAAAVETHTMGELPKAGDVASEAKPPKPAPAEENDERSFAEAMADVQPMDRGTPRVTQKPPKAPPISKSRATSEDQKMLQKMGLWIEKKVDFRLAEDAERIEGSVTDLGLSRRRKLRKGEFAVQNHLDLHGLDATAAQEETERFILDAVRAQHRCVLIVHGKGLHSKTDQPVLKRAITKWLTRGAVGRCVLAFTSALPCDGGRGAIYVLLRKSPASGDGKKAILRQE